MNLQKNASTIIVAALISLVSISCDDDNSNTNPKGTTIKKNLETNTWIITQYFDEHDQTFHFSGYVFTFNDDGTVAAVKDASAVNGTWSVSSSSNGTVKVVLDFGVIDPFDELNDDWNVTEHTNDLIRLEDVSGGSGGTDLLTFERT